MLPIVIRGEGDTRDTVTLRHIYINILGISRSSKKEITRQTYWEVELIVNKYFFFNIF